MAGSIGTNRGGDSKTRNGSLHKGRRRRPGPARATGGLGPRVKRVGGEKFALVCIDPAKRRSEWLMADYFGNLLIEPRTLEHQGPHFRTAIDMIRVAQREHGIEDLIVALERTGNYHLAPQRAFAAAGFETRIVHPFATRQFRQPADPGNKTDHTDLLAQHRAAVAGFGLKEAELDEGHRRLRLLVRHRRSLVEKAAALACQIREHLHLAMPGYAELFSNFFTHRAARAIARICGSAQSVLELGADALEERLREEEITFQRRTIDKVLCWARQTVGAADPDTQVHRAIVSDLDALHQRLQALCAAAECEIAGALARTRYVRLLAVPGIHVVSAGDFAGEMGPIGNYANANAITGRSGLYPSRYQSDQTDHADGALVRMANRRLRGTLMRIADNLVRFNGYYRGQAECDRARRADERAIRVRVAKRFSRLAFACVAGDQRLNHPSCRSPDSILEKLRAFHHEHGTPPDVVLGDLEAAVEQLLPDTRNHEAQIVTEVLEHQAARRRRTARLSELLPAVLARLTSPHRNHNHPRGAVPDQRRSDCED